MSARNKLETAGQWFWQMAKPNKETGCIEWQSTNTNGYGKVRVSGKRMAAHRVAFYLGHGYFPANMVCHKCDNRRCVNPSHLFEGTAKDNCRDAISKGRFDFRGEKSNSAKLTKLQVGQIRSLKKSGELNCRALARRLGVSHTAISEAARQKTWVEESQ